MAKSHIVAGGGFPSSMHNVHSYLKMYGRPLESGSYLLPISKDKEHGPALTFSPVGGGAAWLVYLPLFTEPELVHEAKIADHNDFLVFLWRCSDKYRVLAEHSKHHATQFESFIHRFRHDQVFV
jgi:hypothetical protein